jgi:hypothetical protein
MSAFWMCALDPVTLCLSTHTDGPALYKFGAQVISFDAMATGSCYSILAMPVLQIKHLL